MQVISPSVLYSASALIFLGLPAYLFGFRTGMFYLLLAGLLPWTALIADRAIFTGVFLPYVIFEESFFLPWCMALITLIVGRPHAVKTSDGASLIVPGCLTLAWALFAPLGVQAPSPFMVSVWPPVFFAFEGLSHAFFLAAAWFALLHLTGRQKAMGFRAFMTWGFVCYSLAQVSGAVWSYLGWGTPFHWNMRHLSSASIWCFYAAALHLRFTGRWAPRREAWLALIGLALLIFFVATGQINESRMLRIGGTP